MKQINREAIQRMVNVPATTNQGGEGEGGSSMAGYATQVWVEGNFLSKEFFDRIFTIHGTDANDDPVTVEPNDMDTTIVSVESMFGFWTDFYLSALGQGSGGSTAITLSMLDDVQLTNPTSGQVLTYNGTKWVNADSSGGIDIGAVWTALAAGTSEQINASHLTTALTNYATQTWIGQNYLPLSGGTVSGILTVSPSQVSGLQDGLVLHDNGGGTGEGLRIRWTSASYSTGVYLTGHPDTGLLDINGETVATQTWVGQNYISIAFFNRLFKAYNNNTEVSPNDTTSTINNIKSMFGFWTEFYLSALGQGSGGSAAITLSMLDDVQLTTPTSGQVLTYNGTKWVNADSSGGVDIGAVWTALAAGTSEQINVSHLTNALTDYATQTWVGQNYLPLSGGIVSGLLTLSPSQATGPQDGLILHDNGRGTGEGLRIRWTSASYSTGVYLTGHPDTGLLDINGETVATRTWAGQNYLPLSGGTVSGLLTVSPSQATGPQDGIVLHDSGTGSGEGMRIRWTSASYSTGVYLTGHPDTGLLDINGETVATRTWVNTQISDMATQTWVSNNYLGINATAAAATKLATARTLWGQSFDGTANVTGDMSSVGNIAFSASGKNIGGLLYFNTTNSRIGVGNSSPSYMLDVNGVIHAATGILSNGYVTALSDIRMKNVKSRFELDPLKIAGASLIRFEWKEGHDRNVHVGGIAQEWDDILPEAVIRTGDGMLAMDYGTIGMACAVSLARKVVEQDRRIERLEKRIERLERLL